MPRPKVSDRRGRRSRLRPSPESLEPRALLTVAGSLDLSFGGGSGYVLNQNTSTANRGLTTYTAVVVEPDGSILVDGPVGTADSTFGAIHLGPDGAADPSFGTAGEADVVLPAGVTPTGPPTELLRQADGKFLLVGAAQTADTTPQPVTIVARFDAQGHPDPTFGTAGVLALDQAAVGVLGASLPYAALQHDGKIVLVGSGVLSGTVTEVASVRLTTTGTLDPTYGTGGLVTISDIPPGSPMPTESALGVAFQPDGKIVILADLTSSVYVSYAGSMSLQTSITAELIRLDPDGTRDASLNQAGLLASDVYSPFANGLIIRPDGKFLLLGRSSGLKYAIPVVALLNADGSYANEMAVIDANGFALQPDGKVVLVGSAESYPENEDFVAYRTTADLNLDPTFGTGGKSAILSLPSIPDPNGLTPNYLLAHAVGIGQDGRITVVGSSFFTPSPELVVARLKGTTTKATPGDYTGDGISDPALFLPKSARFVVGNSSGGPPQVVQLGVPGQGHTIPAPGDYYGTGQQDIAAYIVQTGYWAIKDPTGLTPGLLFPFGVPSAGQTLPAQGDYFGAGSDQVAVYLAQSATWDILAPGLKPGLTFAFGQPGVGNTVPVSGDYLGVGSDQVAVYLPQSATWSILGPGLTPGFSFHFGIPGQGNAIPMPGDYDGSGRVEPAVYLPSLAAVQYISGLGSVVTIPFGVAGFGETLPAPGDYDGSGETEVAAYFPSSGEFVYRPASGGVDIGFSVGFVDQGPIVPVTRVVPLSSLPGGSASASAVRPAGGLGQADALDFVMPLASSKKPKPGDPQAT